jgi:hypothetical protein
MFSGEKLPWRYVEARNISWKRKDLHTTLSCWTGEKDMNAPTNGFENMDIQETCCHKKIVAHS